MVEVDFTKDAGPVKPMHGVGQPPMVGALGDWPMMHYLKEAGIPYSRLHDVGGWLGGGLYVDIPNLFPDFRADENDPANYRFAYTDSLLKVLDGNGVEPFFRLGVTIENFVERGYPPVNIMPPEDFGKWARVCEHVVRHYTEGWADGFRMKISHWEIWNEPDGNPDANANPMWRGTFAEYIRLYGTTATHLKNCFPHLMIGGYGGCGFYAGQEDGRTKFATPWPRLEYFVTCARDFLTTVRDNGWPLDFFSFHSYSGADDIMRQVSFADALLDEYGFPKCRCGRILDEWLPDAWTEACGSDRQAADIAATLIALQRGPCDIACIYDARCGVGAYSPLFNPLTQQPHKAYYALKCFNELFRLKREVKSVSGDPGLYVLAAGGPDGGAVFVANATDTSRPFAPDLGGMEIASCRITDATRTDDDAPTPAELPPHSFALLTVHRAASRQ